MNNRPPRLRRRQEGRELHAPHYVVSLALAGKYAEARALWRRLGLERRTEKHAAVPSHAPNHASAAAVARGVMIDEWQSLRAWLGAYGIRGQWVDPDPKYGTPRPSGLGGNELGGGYGSWSVSHLLAARRSIHPLDASEEVLCVELDDTLDALRLLFALFTVHVGDGAPMPAGVPFHTIAPGGRWGLTETGWEGQILRRTNLLGCLLSEGRPQRLQYPGGEHHANWLARWCWSPPRGRFESAIGTAIHGDGDLSPAIDAARQIAEELTRIGLRLQDGAVWIFERASQTDASAYCVDAEADRYGFGYAAGTERRPAMAMSAIGGKLHAAPFEGRSGPLAVDREGAWLLVGPWSNMIPAVSEWRYRVIVDRNGVRVEEP